MSEAFDKMVDEAVERKLRQLAEKAADRIIERMRPGHPMQHATPHPLNPPGRRKVMLFPGHAMVEVHPNAESMVQQYTGRTREVAEALIMLSREYGPTEKQELLRKALSFLGQTFTQSGVSSVASQICRAGILVVQKREP